MNAIYLVVGVILIITGFMSSAYFAILVKRGKHRKGLINHLLDGLGALFLGFFYIYSYVELQKSSKYPTTSLTFQEETYLNVSEEPLVLNFLPTFPTLYQPSTNDVDTETTTKIPTTTENFTALNKNPTTPNSDREITMIPLIDNLKDDSFSFYQNYFKDLIKQKTSNSSKFANRTIFYNNKEYAKSNKNKTKTRRKRELKEYIDPSVKCFKRIFLKHSLLICSFLYSVICLINNTKFCYEHKPQNSNEESKQENMEDSNKPSQIPEGSTVSLFVKKNEQFETEEKAAGIKNPTEKSSPNLDIFLAKSTKPRNQKENKKSNETASLWSSKYILKLILIWFSPGLCVFTLHIIMEGQNSQNHSIPIDFTSNFTPIEVNKDVLKLINNPPNAITQENSKEINDIIENIYNIVEGISKQPESKTHLDDDVMYDIIHYLNRNHDKKKQTNVCTFNTPTLKIHSFLIFCIVYFGSIFYSKMLEIKMKLQEKDLTEHSTIYIYVYIIIWLPCILELLSRIYILDENPSAISDITLALANLFIVFNNFNNYMLNKQIRKTCVVVKI